SDRTEETMADSCSQLVVDYYESTAIHALLWTQLVLSLGAIFVVAYTIMFQLHKSWFEGVFQETLYALYFFILWHSILLVVLLIIQLSIRLTAKNPCEMQFDRKFCFIRILTSFAFPSFVCLHASITVQRIVTSFSGNSKLHHFVARCCLVLTLLLFSSFVMMFVDLLNVLLAFVLIRYNRRKNRDLWVTNECVPVNPANSSDRCIHIQELGE
ncbi:hypothetical protein PMAYCL1PPCAC_10756, partial [Pristionchus mayeri]